MLSEWSDRARTQPGLQQQSRERETQEVGLNPIGNLGLNLSQRNKQQEFSGKEPEAQILVLTLAWTCCATWTNPCPSLGLFPHLQNERVGSYDATFS